MSILKDGKLFQVRKMYYKEGMNMSKIAQRFNISLDAVAYFMRKHGLLRRTPSESNAISFNNKLASFSKKKLSTRTQEFKAILAMLYWGEGYKGNTKLPSKIVDFTNSDPKMVALFLFVLRGLYVLDEKKFRIQLYCYSDQKVGEIIKFWSSLSSIPRAQFIKPYIRNDFKSGGRKMIYGMVHIRYHDKKLLLEIINLIHYFSSKYAPVV